MGIFNPVRPPYEPLEWSRKPLAERGRMVCEAWAMQGYGTPPGMFAAYCVKVVLYVGGWLPFCGVSPSLGGPARLPIVVAFPGRVPEGHRLEHALRGPGVRVRQRAPHRALLPARRRVPLFPSPGTTKLPCFRASSHRGTHARRARRTAVPRRRRRLAASLVGSAPGGHDFCRSSCSCLCSAYSTGRVPRRARRALLGHDRVLRLCEQLDRRRQSHAARVLVLGRRLEAQTATFLRSCA